MPNKLLTFMLLCLPLMACSPDKQTVKEEQIYIDTIPTMVMQIQKCSRLYTTEFQMHRIITHSDTKQLTGSIMNRKFTIDLPVGQRQVAIPVNATLKAYVDFANFSEENVRRSGEKIEIILPDPQIILTSTKVDHKEVKQYVALLRSNFAKAVRKRSDP